MSTPPSQFPNRETLMELISQHRGFMIAEGILFIIFGALAVALPAFSTITLELFLGWLLIIVGAMQGFRAFRTKNVVPFEMILASALIYLTIGVLLLAFPLTGVLTLTVVLMILYFVQGIVQIIMGLQYRSLERSGWLIFSGILTLLVAFIIWKGFPETAHWVLGLLVGINFIVFGAAILALVWTAKRPE